ncbi:MAG: hypothetical protein WKF30_15885 [Pyrinomonadaceae bacterium]
MFHDRESFRRPAKGAGGTPGGLGEFFCGLALFVAGGYLLASRVTVSSGFWYWSGYNLFGLSLVPLLIGIGLLFYHARSIIGWILLATGSVIIFAGILMNLQIFFQPTSLFHTLLMLTLLVGGLGLIAKSLKAHDKR